MSSSRSCGSSAPKPGPVGCMITSVRFAGTYLSVRRAVQLPEMRREVPSPVAGDVHTFNDLLFPHLVRISIIRLPIGITVIPNFGIDREQPTSPSPMAITLRRRLLHKFADYLRSLVSCFPFSTSSFCTSKPLAYAYVMGWARSLCPQLAQSPFHFIHYCPSPPGSP